MSAPDVSGMVTAPCLIQGGIARQWDIFGGFLEYRSVLRRLSVDLGHIPHCEITVVMVETWLDNYNVPAAANNPKVGHLQGCDQN